MMLCLTTVGHAQSLRSSNNSYIGKVESDGTIRNSNNSYMGKVESDGTVRNSNNSYIGKIENDGTVRNSNNSSIGTARGVPKTYAAVLFMFDFF